MADIQFEEEKQFRQFQQSEKKSFFIRLVLGTGVVSTDRQAEYVLLGFAALLIILAFLIPVLLNSQSNPELPPGASIINIPGQPPRLLLPTPGR